MYVRRSAKASPMIEATADHDRIFVTRNSSLFILAKDYKELKSSIDYTYKIIVILS